MPVIVPGLPDVCNPARRLLEIRRAHTKVGCRPVSVRLESVSQYDASSVLLGGLIGWGIDSATGGNKRLYPESVHVVLVPDAAQASRAGDPTFEQQLQRLDDLKRNGRISDDEYAVMRRRLIELVTPAMLSAVPAAVPATAPRPLLPDLRAWLPGNWRSTGGTNELRIGADLTWTWKSTAGGHWTGNGQGTIQGETVTLHGWHMGGPASLPMSLRLTREGSALVGELQTSRSWPIIFVRE